MTDQIYQSQPVGPQGDQRRQGGQEKKKKRRALDIDQERKRFLSAKRRDVFISQSLDSEEPAVYSNNPALRQKLLEQRCKIEQQNREHQKN